MNSLATYMGQRHGFSWDRHLSLWCGEIHNYSQNTVYGKERISMRNGEQMECLDDTKYIFLLLIIFSKKISKPHFI